MRDYLLQNIDRAQAGSMKWKNAHPDEIPLWVADMDFPAPPQVKAELEKRAGLPYYPYSLVQAGLTEAFSAWCRSTQGWDPAKGALAVAGGVLVAMSAAVNAFTKPGDAVLVQTPVYPPFFNIPGALDRKVIRNPLVCVEDRGLPEYRMDLAALEKSVVEHKVRLMYLCSPHNPAGRVWTRQELLDLAAICRRHDIMVISDEIHGDLVRPGVEFLSAARLVGGFAPGLGSMEGFDPERTLVIQAPSKTFNIPGLGCGVVWAARESTLSHLIRVISKLGISTVNIFSLSAAQAAYAGGLPWLEEVKAILEENSAILDQWLTQHPSIRACKREGTYLAWLHVQEIQAKLGLDGMGFQNWLRKEARVYLSPGPQFGANGEGWIRLNLGCAPETLGEGLKRISAVISPLGF